MRVEGMSVGSDCVTCLFDWLPVPSLIQSLRGPRELLHLIALPLRSSSQPHPYLVFSSRHGVQVYHLPLQIAKTNQASSSQGRPQRQWQKEVIEVLERLQVSRTARLTTTTRLMCTPKAPAITSLYLPPTTISFSTVSRPRFPPFNPLSLLIPESPLSHPRPLPSQSLLPRYPSPGLASSQNLIQALRQADEDARNFISFGPL
ncbi:hypothetical protein CONPUDRAFT_138102 [Coniophora puteana RWD-64-598 SS2]|uniref:Uncharacterized protein n=1 Tax=Coniophora puteana (strain RWD-64-598) TaxID=741705 RepID=A0A5M3MLF9_CONPW|nr:uncharacterized protein CONPUDRAFT_138102 [Coniophora puteana RWD-64-598 SS2]EIW79998.1 hypothetical protein CONPUDRAFT_138102 [Coniophora puteana RWD-64-598 SS2]